MRVIRPKKPRTALLLGAWIAIELACLPAAAQIVDRATFRIPAKVVVADARLNEPGRQSYLVATNGPFVVEVENVIGRVDVDVTTTGRIHGLAYGGKAQSPGPSTHCSFARLGITRVYQSDRRTAFSRGEIQDQAVRVDVRYDESARPKIRIVAVQEGYALPGEDCAKDS